MTGRAPDPQRWQRLTELFDQALELDAAGRRDLLDAARGEDHELAEELQRLLAADAADSVLDSAGTAAALARMDEALERHGDGPDLAGTHIGAYRIERLLGRGGMGRVFLAMRVDGEFEQRVALKVLRAGLIDDLARRRFLEERRVLARLSHPHIARLYDGGLGPDGEPWYAMEYIDGDSLIDWCDARKLSVAERIDLFRKVCDAVDFAHRHLVIHRDIKPGNILVDAEGNPKLLDFGIAKLLTRRDAETRNETGLMTPEYAAPEQLRGGAISTATDTYSLGAVLFELLSGQRPFADPLSPREPPSIRRACATSSADVKSRAEARATDPAHLRTTVRGDLERILRTALDPDPARRYRGADLLAADLHRHLRGRPISLRNDRSYRFGKFLKRHRLGVAIGAIAVIALITTSGIALWQAHVARAQAQRAEAVRDFMVGVFASSDPAQHPGIGPSARELLDTGTRTLRNQFDNDPETAADLSRALARSYAGIGAFDPARGLASDALGATLRLHGAGSKPAIEARLDYAEILQLAGQQAQALQQAAVVLQHADAADTVSIARAHLVTAAADNELLHEPQAETEAARALKLAQTLRSPQGEHLQAVAWNDLAQTDLGRGNYTAAQRALREAGALYERTLGANAAQTIDTRTELIFLLLHTGHENEALGMYARLVDGERTALGAASPKLAETLGNYAFILWDTGHYSQSRSIAEQTRQTLAAATGMSPLLRADSEMDMAILARIRGDLPDTTRTLDRIERILAPLGTDAQRLRFGAHWLRAATAAERGESDAPAQLDALQSQAQAMHYNLGFRERMDWPLAWLAIGNPQRALQMYGELAALPSDKRLQLEHRKELLLAQGITLVQLGRFAGAKKMLADAITAFAGKPGDAMNAVTAKLWQGWLAVRAGHAQSGLADIETALAWRRAQLGDDSYLTAEARLAHAEALSRLGRGEEAAREQALANGVFVAMLAPSHSLRKRAESPLPR